MGGPNNNQSEPSLKGVLLDSNPAGQWVESFWNKNISQPWDKYVVGGYHKLVGIADSHNNPLDAAALASGATLAQDVAPKALVPVAEAGGMAAMLSHHKGVPTGLAAFGGWLDGVLGRDSPIMAGVLIPLMDVIMNIAEKIHLGDKLDRSLGKFGLHAADLLPNPDHISLKPSPA